MSLKTAQKSKTVEKNRKLKSQSWKKTSIRVSKTRKVKHAVSRYLTVFALFSISFVFLFSYVAFRKLTSPFVSAFSTTSYDLRNEEIFTTVMYSVEDLNSQQLVINNINVLFFDTSSNKIVSFRIPTTFESDVPGKYAKEPLSKLLALGMSVNNDDLDKAITLSNTALANLIAYPIDRYIIVDRELSSDFEEFFLKGNPTLAFNIDFLNALKYSMKTNLTTQEMYFLYKFTSMLPQDRFLVNSVSGLDEPVKQGIDADITDLTFDSEVALEKKSIAVLNGTAISGMAGFSSRVINNLGGRVISVDTTSELQEESILIVDDKTSATTRNILKFFKVKNVFYKSEISDIYVSEMDRSDVVLILGIDIVNSL